MRIPMGGRLLTMLKPIPRSCSSATARTLASVSCLSGVTRVPSTSEITSASDFTTAALLLNQPSAYCGDYKPPGHALFDVSPAGEFRSRARAGPPRVASRTPRDGMAKQDAGGDL